LGGNALSYLFGDSASDTEVRCGDRVPQFFACHTVLAARRSLHRTHSIDHESWGCHCEARELCHSLP